MFCPNCGQQQVSSNLRFCSRCGFPLGLVAEVLSHGGSLPQLATLEGKKNLYNRKNVFLFGLSWFLVFVLLLVPLAAVILGDTYFGEFLVPIAAILGTMGGFLIMLFSLYFPSSRAKVEQPFANRQNFAGTSQLHANTPQNALPPQSANFNPVNNAYVPPAQQPIPVSRDWREANTNELNLPPSVTEDTTKLLEKEP